MSTLALPVRPDWADPDVVDLGDDMMIFWSSPTQIGGFTACVAQSAPLPDHEGDADAHERSVFLDGERLSLAQARELAAVLVRLADLLDSDRGRAVPTA